MDQFVDSKRGEGLQHSDGTFTLNQERAREQVKRFLVAHPGAYCLKVVQAAVQSNAESIDITVGRNDLTIQFPSTDPELNDPQKVWHALDDAVNLPHSALRDLAVAINGALDGPELKLRWETPLGSLVCDPKPRLDPHRSEVPRLVLTRRRPLRAWWMGSLFRKETEILEARCQYCPASILVDGRPLTKPPSQVLWTNHLGLEKPGPLLESPLPGQGLRLSEEHADLYTEVEGASTRVRQGDLPYGLAELALIRLGRPWQSHLARGLLQVDLDWEGSGTLIPVAHGVALEPITDCDLGHPGVTVTVEASHLRRDLSEFQLVQGQEFETFVQALQKEVRSVLCLVTEKDLRLALSEAKIPPSRSLPWVGDLHYWLQNHTEYQPDSLLDLTRQCWPQNKVLLAPEIPEKKAQVAQSVHANHLLPGEPIIALYDDTVFGSAKVGFVVTPYRFCWKDRLTPARYVLFKDLMPDSLKLEGGQIRLMGESLFFATGLERCLARFFARAKSLASEPPTVLSEQAEHFRSLCARTLGAQRGLHYAPHIPGNLLAAARTAYQSSLPGEWMPVVLHDDTVFGSGDNGFILALEGVAWKSLMEAPRSLTWAEIKGRQIEATDKGVKLGEDLLWLSAEELRPLATSLFQQLCATAEIP